MCTFYTVYRQKQTGPDLFWTTTLFVMCTLTNTSQTHRENILTIGIFIGICSKKLEVFYICCKASCSDQKSRCIRQVTNVLVEENADLVLCHLSLDSLHVIANRRGLSGGHGGLCSCHPLPQSLQHVLETMQLQ